MLSFPSLCLCSGVTLAANCWILRWCNERWANAAALSWTRPRTRGSRWRRNHNASRQSETGRTGQKAGGSVPSMCGSSYSVEQTPGLLSSRVGIRGKVDHWERGFATDHPKGAKSSIKSSLKNLKSLQITDPGSCGSTQLADSCGQQAHSEPAVLLLPRAAELSAHTAAAAGLVQGTGGGSSERQSSLRVDVSPQTSTS